MWEQRILIMQQAKKKIKYQDFVHTRREQEHKWLLQWCSLVNTKWTDTVKEVVVFSASTGHSFAYTRHSRCFVCQSYTYHHRHTYGIHSCSEKNTPQSEPLPANEWERHSFSQLNDILFRFIQFIPPVSLCQSIYSRWPYLVCNLLFHRFSTVKQAIILDPISNRIKRYIRTITNWLLYADEWRELNCGMIHTMRMVE